MLMDCGKTVVKMTKKVGLQVVKTGPSAAPTITSDQNEGAHSFWSDVIVGAALGPVFTTCSPTFFVILATVLPQSIGMGLIDLAAYIIGLALILLLVAFIGQRIIDKLGWATDPKGWFRKILGIIFILLGILIVGGYDKKIESDILTSGF